MLIHKSWPHHLYLGDGISENIFKSRIHHQAGLLVKDSNVSSSLTEIVQRTRTFQVVEAPRKCTLDNCQELSQIIRSTNGQEIWALGGGTTIDSVKLATILSVHPHLFERIKKIAPRQGFIPLQINNTTEKRIVALPTTLGTGTEVSSNASIELSIESETFKVLCNSHNFLPKTAILDSQHTSSLPTISICQGIFEVTLRVFGSIVNQASNLTWSELEAKMILTELAQLSQKFLDANSLDDDERTELAILSATTHTGWALQGRPIAPSILWILADEISSVLKITKLQASVLALPGWLHLVETKGFPWGNQEQLNAVYERYFDQKILLNLTSWLKTQIVSQELSLSQIDCNYLTNRLQQRWGKIAKSVKHILPADLELIFLPPTIP